MSTQVAHPWNSSATKFLFLPQPSIDRNQLGYSWCAPRHWASPILFLPTMNPCAGNLGPTNIHIRFIIFAQVYMTILFPCCIYTYVCIFRHHPILTFLLGFIQRTFVNHIRPQIRGLVNRLRLLLFLRDAIRSAVLTELLMIMSNHKINLCDMNLEISNLCPNNPKSCML